jgi:hypothetical protein
MLINLGADAARFITSSCFSSYINDWLLHHSMDAAKRTSRFCFVSPLDAFWSRGTFGEFS